MFVLQLGLQQPKYHKKSLLFYTLKYTAAMPTNLSGDQSLILLPYLLLMWFSPAFGFTKEKSNLLLDLRKSEILLHFWCHSCWVRNSSWVSSAIFPYSESSWSAVHLLPVWKDFVTCKGTLLSVIHVTVVVKAWQMNLASSLACRKHSLCEQNMGHQGCL